MKTTFHQMIFRILKRSVQKNPISMNKVETVRNYMTSDLITFTPDTDIQKAMKTIVKNRISGAPVVDGNGHLIGMLSESDCIKTVVDSPYNNLPGGNGTVRDFMSTNVVTVSPDKTIVSLAYEFTTTPYRRFPVVEKSRLIGQISRSDVLRAILQMKPTITHTPSSWKGRVPR